MRLRRHHLLLACALAGAATPARAQDGAARLDTVVVSATRSAEPISAIPGSVMVVERAEIERQMELGQGVSGMLQKLIPGYGVSNQTLSEASETFRGRGFQVLVDGVARTTALRNVSRYLAAIDPNSIERIEVINGSSAAYGNGAAGGIINIITRKAAATPEFTASTGARAYTANVGESLAPEASFSYRGDLGPVDMVATVSGRQTRAVYDGSGARAPSDAMLGQGGADNLENYTGLLKLGKSFDAKRLEVSANVVRLDQAPDYYTDYYARPVAPDYTAAYDGRNVMEHSTYLTGSYEDGDFALGQLTLTLAHNDIEKRFAATRYDQVYNNQVYYSGNPAAPTNATLQGSSLTSKVTSLALTVNSPLTGLRDGMELSWGLDLGREETRQQRGDGADIIAPAEQTSIAAFAQLETPVTQWLRLRGGVRHERLNVDLDGFVRPAVYAYNPAAGRAVVLPAAQVSGGSFEYDATLYNLGAVVDLAPGLELFGGLSQGFSLPDWGAFTRRAGVTVLGVTGDLSLLSPKAQKVTTYEVGLRGGAGAFDGSLSAYLSTSDEGLTFNPATNAITQSKEHIKGIEATARYDIRRDLSVGLVAAWIDGEYDSNGDGSIDRPLPNSRIASPFKATAHADWQVAGWRLHGEAVYVMGRDSHPDQLELDDTVTFNAAAATGFAGGTASIGIENLFDADNINAAASATRNIPVAALGRAVVLRYTRTW